MKKRAFLLLMLLLMGIFFSCALAQETQCTQHREFCPGDGVCDACGAETDETAVYHAYSVCVGYDEATHTLQCPGCGDTVIQPHAGDCTSGCKTEGCGYTELDDGVHQVVHDYGREYVFDDVQHYKECARCGEKKDVADHEFAFSHVLTGTCQTPGGEVYRCICGAEQTHDFSQLGSHHYTMTETPPSCEKTGSCVMVCDYCGETLVDTYPALQHVWNNYDRDLPTCTQDGMTYYQCELCGDYLEETLPTRGHDFKLLEVDGDAVEVCLNCGQLKEKDAEYQLIYSVNAARRQDVRLRVTEGLTAADYENFILTLYYADGSAEEAAFRVEKNEVIFRVKKSCTAIFTLK